MAKKLMSWKTKGMNRDLSVSAFNPEFSFENINLRLSTAEGNTMMSWVNEKGTAPISTFKTPIEQEEEIVIDGITIGTAVIDHKLIIFTTGKEKDHIYQLKFADKENHKMEVVHLYEGNLNFSEDNPLETLVSYEAEDIQKVYFTDWVNQPRVINIVGTIKKDNQDNYINTQFDFIPAVQLSETVSITQNMQGGGLFAPGVIQYAMTYYNKYGQQSNVVYVSPIYYLALPTRGASPEEKVSCSFKIDITDPDDHFDYLRIYSIQRTSLDATPIVKIVEDLKVGNAVNNSLSYTDNGTNGSSVDPTELLFVGGKEIAALTMVEKDKTLFLGNIKQKNSSIEGIQNYFLTHDTKPQFTIAESYNSPMKTWKLYDAPDVYPYESSLKYNQEQQSTFKGGEWYRFGIQLQKKSGEWSEPIYLGDVQNTLYPKQYYVSIPDEYYYSLPYAELNFNWNAAGISREDYVKIRPVVVFPTIGDRDVICQGVLNPTVFNVEDRKNGTPFAQASWYFRPYGEKIQGTAPGRGKQPTIFGNAAFEHYASLRSYDDVSKKIKEGTQDEYYYDWKDYNYFQSACDVEIQGSVNSYINPFASENTNVHSNTQFFIDQSIVTLNSPDIEFDTEVQSMAMEGLKLRVIGYIPINATASSHSITTNSNMLETAYNLNWGTDGAAHVEGITDHSYGTGEHDFNTLIYYGETVKGTRMVAGNLWNDSLFVRSNNSHTQYSIIDGDPFKDKYFDAGAAIRYIPAIYQSHTEWEHATHNYTVNFFVHPWQSKGSLTNDNRSEKDASSLLRSKRESNLLFSLNTKYLDTFENFNNINSHLHLTENNIVYKIGLPKQLTTSSSISYYPNVDKVLNNSDGFKVLPETYTADYEEGEGGVVKTDKGYSLDDLNKEVIRPIPMKYKSTSHAIIALNATQGGGKIPILPYNIGPNGMHSGEYSHPHRYGYNTFWGDTNMKFSQNGITTGKDYVLWLGELYYGREVDYPRFGGTGKEALKSNTWLIGGEAVDIPNVSNDPNDPSTVNLKWTIGDTYYQRYDCLKTYAFTHEDINQLVEILSFMCETHVNIDGRYDNNRGQIVSHSMSPTNFNLMNYAYSQKNNYFSYKKTNSEKQEDSQYSNWVAYSKTKESGADVDLWANVTLGSVLELDGDKGEVTSLQRFNNQVIAFQDSAISQILYNERVQISPNQGVPIEIANSGKVDGKSYLSDTIGCSNKHSICATPAGIYFMDSNNKGIYRFSGQLENISLKYGFDAWCKQNIPDSSVKWNPLKHNNFASYYDKKNQDVLWIGGDKALAWSDKHQVFTSFYDYSAPYFCNLDDEGIWLNQAYVQTGPHGQGKYITTLWQHQAGEHNKFFGLNYPYSMTLVGNPEPQTDKIFTNLEFRANVSGEGTNIDDKYTPFRPFDSLEAWDEYQHGITALSNKNGHDLFKHGGSDSALIRKFRIWRCDIPRDNVPASSEQPEYPIDYMSDADLGITRFKKHPNDRMRNPWLYLKLLKKAESDPDKALPKAEIHDIVMTYFN